MADQVDADQEVEPPSTLPNIMVSVQGLENEGAARLLGQGMIDVVREVGRVIDVGSLDGITIAVDYDAALRDLDRGIHGLQPEGRTNDEALVGVAKSILVKRGAEVKTHLVFAAGPVSCLAFAEPEEEDFQLALAVIAHECAHVEEHTRRDRQFPGVLLDKQVEGFVPVHLQQFSEAFWCEYAVCRASAVFARAEGDRFRNALSVRLGPARETARNAIKAYRSHSDVERVFQEVGFAILEPLRMASYLFGHLDGLAQGDLPDVSVELPPQDDVFVSGMNRLVAELRSLWDSRDTWQSHDDMLVLGETGLDVIRRCGVDVQPRENGRAYINVPFTPDTLPAQPNLAELLARSLRGFS